MQTTRFYLECNILHYQHLLTSISNWSEPWLYVGRLRSNLDDKSDLKLLNFRSTELLIWNMMIMSMLFLVRAAYSYSLPLIIVTSWEKLAISSARGCVLYACRQAADSSRPVTKHVAYISNMRLSPQSTYNL